MALFISDQNKNLIKVAGNYKNIENDEKPYSYHNHLGPQTVNITNCTTLEEIITLAKNNPNKMLEGTIGNDPGTQPLRTLLGFPNGWGNYVDVQSTRYQKLPNSSLCFLELCAHDYYGGGLAYGYIHVYYHAVSGAALYSWSKWTQPSNPDILYDRNSSDSNINKGYTSGIPPRTRVVLGDIVNNYKFIRIYFKNYKYATNNVGGTSNVCDMHFLTNINNVYFADSVNSYFVDSTIGSPFNNRFQFDNNSGYKDICYYPFYNGTVQESDQYAILKIEGIK